MALSHLACAGRDLQTTWRPLRMEVLELRRMLAIDLHLVHSFLPYADQGGSLPTDFVEVGGAAYFSAGNLVHGEELWRSDGTPAGTFLVKDIQPGAIGSHPQQLTSVGGALYFVANDGATGPELWKSDGTGAGTVLVKDIAPGATGIIQHLTNVSGTLFFAAYHPETDIELWKSDGTYDGTVLVKDINPGPISGLGSSDLGHFTDLNGVLFFAADDGVTGAELWRSDGTFSGTRLVKDIYPGVFIHTREGEPRHLTNVNGTLFFSARDDGGEELWKSDGTAAGTVRVRDLSGTQFDSSPEDLTQIDAILYFTARSNNIRGLWRSDGTAAGTHLVKADIGEQGLSWAQNNLVNVNGALFFVTRETELWKSDGTTAGTRLVKDFQTTTPYGTLRSMTSFNGALVFSGADGASPIALWTSDGTESGTREIASLTANPSLSERSLTILGSSLIFPANDGVHGTELWKSDGTAAGTSMVRNIRQSVEPQELVDVNGVLYWTIVTGSGTAELWKFDGTPAGSIRVMDFTEPYGSNARPRQLTAVGSTLFFVNAVDGELWKSEGTITSTVRVKDINPGLPGSGFGELADVNGTLFFAASNGTSGVDLWKSDGTESGTVLVKDLPNDGDRSPAHRPQQLTNVSGVLYFTTGYYGDDEVWRSDGTELGTYEIKDIEPIFPGSFPKGLTAVAGKLFFTAFTYAHGQELWASDGTAAGTRLVADLRPGIDSSTGWGSSPNPAQLVNHHGTLYFVADDGVTGAELWKSNGAAAGTVLVRDIKTGVGGSSPHSLVSTDEGLFFIANDGARGAELWRTDGTADGTHLVKEFGPGPQHGSATNLTAVAGSLFFSAYDDATGYELWVSDGTAAGTRIAADIATGLHSGSPHAIVEVGNRAFFIANGEATGVAVWSAAVITPVQPAGDFTQDGQVDGTDFLMWQRQLGTAGNPRGSGADGNRDGLVDRSDLALWRGNFGRRQASIGDYTQDGVTDGADFLLWQRALGMSDGAADGDGDGIVSGEDFGVWAENFGQSESEISDLAYSAAMQDAAVDALYAGGDFMALFGHSAEPVRAKKLLRAR
jgi:ELWxxDGT repeat protein